MRTGLIFVGAIWAVGLLSGLVLAFAPNLLPLPTPHFTVPLVAALLGDLLLRPATAAGRTEPVTMNARAVAVIGGAIVSLAAAAVVGGPA